MRGAFAGTLGHDPCDAVQSSAYSLGRVTSHWAASDQSTSRKTNPFSEEVGTRPARVPVGIGHAYLFIWSRSRSLLGNAVVNLVSPHTHEDCDVNYPPKPNFTACIAVITLGTVLSSSCGIREVESKTQYALNRGDPAKGSLSALKIINSTGGKVRLCFTLPDSRDPAALAGEWTPIFTTAMNTWVKELQGVEGWTVTSVTVNASSEGFVAGCHFDIRIFETPEGWKREMGDSAASMASSSIEVMTMHIGPAFHHERKSERLPMVIHEFGHLIGIGDTYTIPGANEPANQPPAIMNRYQDVSWAELQPDDKAAIRAVWKHVRSSVLACDGAYVPGGHGKNRWNYLFCVPTSAYICVSSPHDKTLFRYAVTKDLRLQVFGDGGRQVADLAATRRNSVSAKLDGRDVEILFDARSKSAAGTSVGLFIYTLLSDGRTYLKHEGQGDGVPMTCTQ